MKDNLTPYFDNLDIDVSISETITHSPNDAEELTKILEEFCKDPWGKTVYFEIHDHEMDSLDIDIEYNSDEKFFIRIDGENQGAFTDAKSITLWLNENITPIFRSRK